MNIGNMIMGFGIGMISAILFVAGLFKAIDLDIKHRSGVKVGDKYVAIYLTTIAFACLLIGWLLK